MADNRLVVKLFCCQSLVLQGIMNSLYEAVKYNMMYAKYTIYTDVLMPRSASGWQEGLSERSLESIKTNK